MPVQAQPSCPSFTPSQRLRAQAAFATLERAQGWNGQLPVLLLNRCWLRLTVVPVDRLALELPPDLSRSAPELERYRALVQAGHPDWQAQQLCWQEFGAEACQQALRHFWRAQERQPPGWTLDRYLDFLAEYRHRLAQAGPRQLPLLVLARPSVQETGPAVGESHGLFWLRPDLSIGERTMRHTCA